MLPFDNSRSNTNMWNKQETWRYVGLHFFIPTASTGRDCVQSITLCCDFSSVFLVASWKRPTEQHNCTQNVAAVQKCRRRVFAGNMCQWEMLLIFFYPFSRPVGQLNRIIVKCFSRPFGDDLTGVDVTRTRSPNCMQNATSNHRWSILSSLTKAAWTQSS